MTISIILRKDGLFLNSYTVRTYKTLRGFFSRGLKKEQENLSKYASNANTIEVWYQGRLWQTHVLSEDGQWVQEQLEERPF